PRGEAPAIRTERRGEDQAGMATQSSDLPAGASVPNSDLTIRLGKKISGGRGEPSAIRAEAHALNDGVMPRQRKPLVARPGVPNSYRFVPAGRGEGLAVGTV